jgi:uncharacterized protein (TIGR02996 family)
VPSVQRSSRARFSLGPRAPVDAQRRSSLLSEDGEKVAFLTAITAQPDDDTARLVYADWLTEKGDADQADFIRAQCGLARDPNWSPLTANVAQLLNVLHKRWQTVFEGIGVNEFRFERGFPAWASMDVSAFIRNSSHLLRRSPTIRSVHLTGRITDDLARSLADCPELQRFTLLDLSGTGISPVGVAALAESPRVAGLEVLGLGDNHFGDEGVRALTTSPHLKRLKKLDLSSNEIGDDGATALANSPHLGQLTSLNLCGNHIGNSGAIAIASSVHFMRLTRLHLLMNPIADAGAIAMASSPLATVAQIDLTEENLGEHTRQLLEGRRRPAGPGRV